MPVNDLEEDHVLEEISLGSADFPEGGRLAEGSSVNDLERSCVCSTDQDTTSKLSDDLPDTGSLSQCDFLFALESLVGVTSTSDL